MKGWGWGFVCVCVVVVVFVVLRGRLREDGYHGFVADLLFVITCPFQLTLYSISVCSAVKPVKREGGIGGGVRFVCVLLLLLLLFLSWGREGGFFICLFCLFFCFFFAFCFFSFSSDCITKMYS